MNSSYQVQVSNIAPATTEATIRDFFTFCGKIEKIDFNSTEPKSAAIFFEKPTAAKTALMLNGGTLDGSTLSVTSQEEHHDDEEHASGSGTGNIAQEDKPRSGIAAEYLAKGYLLSDQVLQRAIEIDQKQGLSSRFIAYIKTLDQTLGKKIAGPEGGPQTLSGKVQDRAKQIDQQQGITTTAQTYYEKAIASPFGQKVFSFYTTTSKQVLDIHEEARRIRDQNKSSTAPPSPEKSTDVKSA